MSDSQRNTRGDNYDRRPKSGKDATVQKELRNLFKSSLGDYEKMSKLRQKYNDRDLLDAITDAYMDRKKHVMKKAQKFQRLLQDRYSGVNLPFHELMKKARKYAKKYKITDDEFNMFKNLALTSKTNMTNVFNLPNTKMAKTLGYAASIPGSEKLRVRDNELNVLNEILKLHAATKSLHSQIVLQSLSYRDCAPEALLGIYRPDKHNAYSYVHPVIAALFLPKFKLLDEHMLISNLGFIVKCKKEGRPPLTQPDYEVYWDLLTDPNDNVCASGSAIKDLHNRFLLQTKLWDSVLNLRHGRYYNEKLTDFLIAVDNCKSSIFDAPDLTYVKDEGAILRRLLSVFSLRPTIVSTTRLYGLFSTNPLLTTPGLTQVTTVPMITLRLPLSMNNRDVAVHLEESLSQPQWYVENKMIIPKNQSIIHSRDILVFYVGRRFQTVNISRLNSPYNFKTLPMTIAGWEAVNDRDVNFQPSMTIFNDIYVLRSVICVEKLESAPLGKQPIVGSTACISIPRDFQAGKFSNDYILYDPQGASVAVGQGEEYVTAKPIYRLDYQGSLSGDSGESFYERASKRGTVFIYQKETENENPFYQTL